ncbi:MAG: tripartite tricarboxylate transporter TctB family protein [Sphaerochaetaceae bacterium]
MEDAHQSKSGSYTRIEGFVFLFLALSAIIYALREHQQAKIVWSQSPYLFPLLIALFLLPLSLSLIRSSRKESVHGEQTLFLVRDTVVVALSTLVYIVVMPYLTFFVSTVLFLFGVFFYLGERRYLLIGLLSLGFPALMYVLFGRLLHVMLP